MFCWFGCLAVKTVIFGTTEYLKAIYNTFKRTPLNHSIAIIKNVQYKYYFESKKILNENMPRLNNTIGILYWDFL